jgi:hypothetical protein
VIGKSLNSTKYSASIRFRLKKCQADSNASDKLDKLIPIGKIEGLKSMEFPMLKFT